MARFDKRRRLEAAIAGEATDRPPVALWRHWPGDDQDAAANAAAHLKWQRDYDWDVLKVSPASSYSVVDWGVVDRWEGHIEGTRVYERRPITRLEDWAALRPLDPSQGMLGTQLEALRLVGRNVGQDVPFLLTVFSPLSQAKHMAGNELLLAHLRQQPGALHEALNIITETTIRTIEASKATGISGIYYAIQHANHALLSQAEYEIFGRPYDLRILEAAGDLWCNIIHLHGDHVMFDLVATYPVPFLNWHDRDTAVSLRDGLEVFPGAASGGVSQWTIHRESPEAMLAETADAMAQTGGRRLMLGTGCVTMVTTPTSNLRAFREAAERSGA
jgi:uroporphyrinogen decarboxylase